MMRSLYSGISGLRNHQTRMDVIGNNIANVNTAGYKTSRVIFQDIFSQNVSGGMANTGNIGGTNPLQIGLGIRLSSVDVLHTRAAFQRTDTPTDMMINGDGFFIVGDREGNHYYTRAGNFSIDDEGYLVNSQGYYVLGTSYTLVPYILDPGSIAFDPPIYPYGPDWDTDEDERTANPGYVPPTFSFRVQPDSTGNPMQPIRMSVFRIDFDIDEYGFPLGFLNETPDPFPFEPGTFEFPEDWENGEFQEHINLWLGGADGTTGLDREARSTSLTGMSVGEDGSISVLIDNRKTVIGTLTLAMFANPAGLEKAGNSLYRETASSGGVVRTNALENGAGRVDSGGLEMSNVDLASEFTDMIVTQRGFQANSRIITVSDTMLEELVNLKR